MPRSPGERARRTRLKAIRRRLRFWWRRRALAASPSIRVRLIDGWLDGPAALAAMTPAASGRVGRVHFAFSHAEEPHYVLVLTHCRGQDSPRLQPPGRVWHAIGEPPLPVNADMLTQAPPGARVYAIGPSLPGPNPQTDYRAGHCLLRTWHVGKGYDELRAMALPADKPLGLSWITSARRWHPGHVRRMEFLARLQREVPFDLWGRGFRPIPDKWDGLAPYRYSIAFENSSYDDYFTEKIADPILAGCLPLYVGCPNLERWLPPGCFVRIDPDDPGVFDQIRSVVASDLWRERRPALEEAKALLLEKYNAFRFLAAEFEADFPRTFGR